MFDEFWGKPKMPSMPTAEELEAEVMPILADIREVLKKRGVVSIWAKGFIAGKFLLAAVRDAKDEAVGAALFGATLRNVTKQLGGEISETEGTSLEG